MLHTNIHTHTLTYAHINITDSQEEFEVERTEIVNTHVRQRKDMTDILAAMEQEFGDAENELRQVRGSCFCLLNGFF